MNFLLPPIIKYRKKTSLGFSYAYQNRNDISCHGTLTTLEKKMSRPKKSLDILLYCLQFFWRTDF